MAAGHVAGGRVAGGRRGSGGHGDGGHGTAGMAAVAGQRYMRGGREIAVGWSRYGDLVISDRVPSPVITEHAWEPGGRLVLRGTYAGPAAALGGVVLQRHGSSERHRLACTRDGDRFTAPIDVSRMPSFGDQLPLRDGRWYLLFEGGAGASAPVAAETAETRAEASSPDSEPETAARPGDALATGFIAARYDPARLADVTEEPVDIGAKEYRLVVVDEDTPMLSVTTNLSRMERGRFNQRLLRRAYYPLKLRAPLRDAVVFVSWKGKQCSDNPLGIAAELRSRGDDREHIWVVTDPAVRAPAGSTRRAQRFA